MLKLSLLVLLAPGVWIPVEWHRPSATDVSAAALPSPSHHVIAVLANGLADSGSIVVAAVLLEQQVEAPACCSKAVVLWDICIAHGSAKMTRQPRDCQH